MGQQHHVVNLSSPEINHHFTQLAFPRIRDDCYALQVDRQINNQNRYEKDYLPSPLLKVLSLKEKEYVAI
jgi:hypothetical protein